MNRIARGSFRIYAFTAPQDHHIVPSQIQPNTSTDAVRFAHHILRVLSRKKNARGKTLLQKGFPPGPPFRKLPYVFN